MLNWRPAATLGFVSWAPNRGDTCGSHSTSTLACLLQHFTGAYLSSPDRHTVWGQDASHLSFSFANNSKQNLILSFIWVELTSDISVHPVMSHFKVYIVLSSRWCHSCGMVMLTHLACIFFYRGRKWRCASIFYNCHVSSLKLSFLLNGQNSKVATSL